MSKLSIVSLVTLFTSLHLVVPPVLANYDHGSHDLHKRHHQIAERAQNHKIRSEDSAIPHSIPLKSRKPTLGRRDDSTPAAEYGLLGCFSETSGGSHLLSDVVPWNATSIHTCVQACYTAAPAPYKYAAPFNGNECRCGNALPDGATQVGQDQCSSTCGADGWCGGPNAYQVYVAPFTPSVPPEATVASDPAPSESPSTPANPEGAPTESPIPSPSPANAPVSTSVVIPNGLTYNYAGCFEDSTTSRVLRGPGFTSDSMSPSLCASYCFGSGYPYAGVEFGNECFCGATIITTGSPIDGCTQTCAGDSTTACGGSSQLGLYTITDSSQITVPSPLPTSSSGKWHSIGCYVDDLTTTYTSIPFFDSTLSVDACTSACEGAGFTRAAMEYGYQCFCAGDNTIENSPRADAHDCDITCAYGGGTCGGAWRWDVYKLIA